MKSFTLLQLISRRMQKSFYRNNDEDRFRVLLIQENEQKSGLSSKTSWFSLQINFCSSKFRLPFLILKVVEQFRVFFVRSIICSGR
ncbi:hypothetical protein HanXRQr2_Chr01g0016231 [Helianthus annuus]|uniref:Uncharacterized protein n=1 Tax=Helianthus annuus TaxID=4232 RepID=A0A9K3P2P7_HELAN|nr:hypothetical protein HanXRQr2_Chr01g0016231 [Helianthus annuus]KAJ0956503.1 hypothetical protein HanPSC8_Chr01g0015551 [Helianthus annuus]